MPNDEIYRLRKTELTWREVGDAVVVLDLSDSTYLSVTGAGRTIWAGLEKGATLAQLVHAVLEVFDVDDDTAHADTTTFLKSLDARQLLAR